MTHTWTLTDTQKGQLISTLELCFCCRSCFWHALLLSLMEVKLKWLSVLFFQFMCHYKKNDNIKWQERYFCDTFLRARKMSSCCPHFISNLQMGNNLTISCWTIFRLHELVQKPSIRRSHRPNQSTCVQHVVDLFGPIAEFLLKASWTNNPLNRWLKQTTASKVLGDLLCLLLPEIRPIPQVHFNYRIK